MKTIIIILALQFSQLIFADDIKPKEISGLVKQVKQLQQELLDYKESQRCYKSEWHKLKENQSKEYTHDLGDQPSKAFIWASYHSNGDKATLIDSIYTYRGNQNSMGYGAWLINVTDKNYKIMLGGGSPSTVDLATGQGLIVEPKNNYYNYIQVVLCK